MPASPVDHRPSPLRLQLLGPFAVTLVGHPLPRLRSPKSLWLLALLVLRRGAPVERDWLAALLWPDRDDQQGLRNSLTELRRALGTEAQRLRAASFRTLALDLAGAEVDLLAFEDAVARGDAESLAEAVALYRGPLLEGCTGEWVFQEREEREQAYLRALERLAAAKLASGEAEAAEGYLRRAAGVDALRESVQRGLMEALAAQGNHAGVLACYRELRDRLHRELNTAPDPATRALFERLRDEVQDKAGAGRPSAEVRNGQHGPVSPVAGELASGHQEPAVERNPRAGSPETVRFNGAGTPGLGELPPEAAPKCRALPYNLPLQLTSFIGRQAEMAEIRQQLAAHRLVTLTGAGGCGKTRLAIEVAAGLAPAYPDGVGFVELAALADPTMVSQTVAAALGIHEQPDRPLIETLVEALKPKQRLLLLDNCEHLVEACAQLAEALLRTCPHLRVLAISREPLGIPGEQPYRVPSLLPDEAVRLFSERAATAQPAFALSAGNRAAVEQICCRLEGIPLAIELAAARLKALPVETLRDRLQNMFALLSGGSRTALPRHQTLRALIDWSYDLLCPGEQTLLRRLSVFAGGCTLEAAEAVCGEGEGRRQTAEDSTDGLARPPASCLPPSDDVLDLFTCLVEKSLVLYEERQGEGRYRLLEMIREYSREKLAAHGESDTLRERHARFFLALTATAATELQRAEAGRWLDRLDREHDNLRAALAGFIESDDPEPGLRMAAAMAGFWHPRGYLREGREQFQRLLAHPGVAAPTAARARALRTAGTFAAHPNHARALYEESLAIGRSLEDRAGIAAALTNLGYLAWGQWDWTTARALAEESLEIGRELGDRRITAGALRLLAEVLRQGIDLPAARAMAEEAVTIYRELDDPVRIAQGLDDLACVVRDQGDLHGARPIFEECLAVARALGDKVKIGWSTLGLGSVLLDLDNLPAARALHEESLALWRALDDKNGLIQALYGLGETVRAQGDSAAAYVHFQEMLDVSREGNWSNWRARALVFMGAAAGDLGRWEETAAHCVEGLRLGRAGDTKGDRANAALGLIGLGRAALAAERPAWAGRLLGATASWLTRVGLGCGRQELHGAELAVRAQMEATEFEAAWAEGQALPIEPIIDQALEAAPAG